MEIKYVLIMLLLVSSVQFLLLKQQVNHMVDSNQRLAKEVYDLKVRQDQLSTIDQYIHEIEEVQATTIDRVDTLHHSSVFLQEKMQQMDEKIDMMSKQDMMI